MNSVERVLAALNCMVPDRLPFAFGYISPAIREKIVGEKLNYRYPQYRVDWAPVFCPGETCKNLEPAESTDGRVARRLGLDALGFQLMTPVMAELSLNAQGAYAIKHRGLTPENFHLLAEGLPNADDETIYEEAKRFVAKYKGEFALFCRIRLGFSPVLTSMGKENCLKYLGTEPNFVKESVAVYSEWMKKFLKNLMECGFDFLWDFDDMADKENPFFTSEQLQEFFIPHLKQAAKEIKIPWIFHSDGNLLPVLNDLASLGMSGIHPLEPGAMDLFEVKRKYGDQLCMVGNIDANHIMVDATSEEIRAYIDHCIEVLSPGGGYIISDSNSVPAKSNPKNIVEISNYIQSKKQIYISW